MGGLQGRDWPLRRGRAWRGSDAGTRAPTREQHRERGTLDGLGEVVVHARLDAALTVAARGGLDGPVVTVLPDAWDRYRAKPWMQEWGS